MTTGTAAIEMFTLQQTKGRIDDDWSALLDILQDMSKKSWPAYLKSYLIAISPETIEVTKPKRTELDSP